MLSLTLTPMSAQGPNNSGEYYKDANGKKGAALKTALCAIIYSRSERTYADIWEDFKTTDVRSDGTIWDMYSNATSYEPGGPAQGANYKKEGDSYNREHSFPNSWFGKKVPPMYTDLHHIFATDGWVNNKRSNYPFGETNGEKYKSANDFSKLGACTYPGYTGIVFEPADEYKGDFARTYFYMVTCYEEKLADWYTNYEDVRPTLDGNTYPGLSEWQLSMLLKWAHNDPVSQKECDRNNAVFTIQENRNPFIDYPGLEQYIWGELTDEPFSYANYPTAIEFKSSTTLGKAEDGIRISVRNGTLYVTSNAKTTLRLLHLDGSLYRLLDVNKGKNRIKGLRRGIYLLNHQKIIIQ
ncbi:MAG: endonuclease [Prevotella sp.]|nr:endonuclease [Prevotella sp.]